MVILALDIGQARIGVALSDELELLATPHAVLRRKSDAQAIEAINRMVAETGAELVAVGLPVSLDRQLHGQARSVQAFADKLRARLSVPMVYVDETLSTVRAEEELRAAGMRPERIRERIDAAAAAVILRDLLEQRRRGERMTPGTSAVNQANPAAGTESSEDRS
jgi:putative Holliday junction resolvase